MRKEQGAGAESAWSRVVFGVWVYGGNNLLAAYPYLQGYCQEDKGDALWDHSRHCQSLKQEKFLPYKRQGGNFRIIKQWSGLPRKLVESPSLDAFKTWLEESLCTLIEMQCSAFIEQEATQELCRGPF